VPAVQRKDDAERKQRARRTDLRKEFFSTVFGIVLESGDKHWSFEDLGVLGQALRIRWLSSTAA
jgi:hypothetical protein